MLTPTSSREIFFQPSSCARSLAVFETSTSTWVDTTEKHYAPFVKELRERARRIIEGGEGPR